MRRFLIRNARGKLVGEGVLWSDQHLTWRIANGELRTIDAAALAFDAAGAADAIMGNRIEWLDPEPLRVGELVCR